MQETSTEFGKYSVLMSVYAKDKSEYLKQSIDSMLDQTIPPDQFVLVKDGLINSEIDSLINQYVREFPDLFTVVTLKENHGLGVALDEGIKYCKNELIARMDSDDISLPDRCAKELKLFKNNPRLSIVSGNIGEFENDLQNIVSIRKVPELHRDIVKRMRIRSAFNHPAVMYRKSDVIRCGGYGKLRRKQDHVLFSHMLHNDCRGYNIQDIILLFRADRDSVRRKKCWGNCRDYIKAQMILFKRNECNVIDLCYVVLSQIVVFIIPYRIYKALVMAFFREGIRT
ncbi:glycosyltransferase [Butyrivibrio sp. NC2007]|uniref:glycosyltransferase n=1 Tax=Butyrivibrio sp. NC2007 TaxID=1280683 RepID=UPI0003B745BD|nr:glycosyltransferase [Butyrivibrio sp. NC2007]